MASPSTDPVPQGMYHLYGCAEGGDAYLVLKTDPQLHLLSLRMQCPKSDCSGYLELGRHPGEGKNACRVHRVSAQELFHATQGLGFSGEHEVNPARVEAVLVGATVRAVSIDRENSNSNKSVVDSLSIQTSEGQQLRLHLATGRYGAVVYRITNE